MVQIPQIGRKLAQKRARKSVRKQEGTTQVAAPAHYNDTLWPPSGALAALMREWREEDAAMTEEEAEQAAADLREFKAAINATRAANGEKLIYP